MSWFTERAPPGPAHRARPWLPHALPPEGATAAREPPDAAPPSPPLAFDEREVARVAAACALKAERDALAACADNPEARRTRAMEQLAAALADAPRGRAEEESVALRRVFQLAAAVARAACPGQEQAQTTVARVEAMLADLPRAPGARLVVTPAAVDRLRPVLPEVAARASLVDRLELDADPHLPEGAVRLLWPGGWMEHDPAALARQIADALAPHGAAATAAAPEATDDGTNDDHEID
jgi:hypothetical protein